MRWATGEEESEHDKPRDRISEGRERGGESQRLGEHEGAEVEQGDGVERNREFDRETEDWGLREKRGNQRVREKRKEKMKGEERENEYKTIKIFTTLVRTVANLQRYCSDVV